MAHDIVIAGGGLAGQIQGLALARFGWHVAVLERSNGVAALADPRSLALSASSRRILEALGVWGGISADSTPVTHIDVSQRGVLGTTRLRAADEGLSALGHVISAGRLAHALREGLQALPHCDFLVNTEVEGVRGDVDRTHLRLMTHGKRKTLSPRALVVADGAHSQLRETLGLKTYTVDYGQGAVVAEVSMDREADGWAYERFTEKGPLALLPGASPQKRALVWAQSHRKARHLWCLDGRQFCQKLQETLGMRAGQVLSVGPRHFYRLAFPRAVRRVAGRCVLIGDAACSFHPVAAQGFNLVIRDAAWLVQQLEGATDPGDTRLLEQYAQDRQKDAWRVAAFTDFLALGFVWRNPVARGLQTLGMTALEGISEMRTRLVRFGMGVDLPQPKLALHGWTRTSK